MEQLILNPLETTAPAISKCEFCEELCGDPLARFNKIYGSEVSSRVVAKHGGFIALPTLGQLFKGSLLVLPESHHETMASLPNSAICLLPQFLNSIVERIRPLGLPLIFEHGAKCGTGAACGIYHAHIHIVPVPRKLQLTDLIPNTARTFPNIESALEHLKFSDAYIMVQDTASNVAAVERTEATSDIFSSQYIRRSLARYFNLEVHWDWREYDKIEPWVIETLGMFREDHVPFSK